MLDEREEWWSRCERALAPEILAPAEAALLKAERSGYSEDVAEVLLRLLEVRAQQVAVLAELVGMLTEEVRKHVGLPVEDAGGPWPKPH
jgi:hypothetical protein